MVDCVFCKIIKGEIASHKVYEDGKVLAILDVNPVNPGHVLIMPKEHYTTITDMPVTLYKYIAGIAWNIVMRMNKKLGFDGLNVVQNNGLEAGQVVPHYHMHLIPRYEGDSDFYKCEWIARNLSDNEMKEIARKIEKK